MTCTRLVVSALVVAMVATGLAGCERDSRDDDAPTTRPSPLSVGTSPQERARIACLDIEAVQAQVTANTERDLVFAYLDASVREISLAARNDPIWISLQSGIESVRRGLQTDDEAASELGIAIARDQCRRAGVYLPGAVSPEPEPTGHAPPTSPDRPRATPRSSTTHSSVATPTPAG